MEWTKKHLLGIEELDRAEIELLLQSAEAFREVNQRMIKKVPTLRGRTVINFFLEPSTRTRTSFEIAAKRMSAEAINIAGSSSSVVKGETLLDTARNLDAMGPDVVVVRFKSSGAPHFIAPHLRAAVVNAGDGAHEHPTQALIDMLTIREHKGRIEGLKVAIVGDILHSRVARSDMLALNKLGAEVMLAGPQPLVPREFEQYGATIHHTIDEILPEADVIMMLRIQQERLGSVYFPTNREYSMFYGLSPARMAKAKKDVVVMHPGPLNRGVEINPRVADGPASIILDQVANGVAVRMAVLYHLSGVDGRRE